VYRYLHAGDVDRECVPVRLNHDEARDECDGIRLVLHLLELGVGVVELNHQRLADIRQALAGGEGACLGAQGAG